MLKLIYVLHRKPELTLEEFQRYWKEQHAPLVASHAATLGIKRYIQVHSRPPGTPPVADPIRGTMLEPFDGVAELWIDAEAGSSDREARRAAQRALALDEANFIDFSRSSLWRGEEHVVVGGEAG